VSHVQRAKQQVKTGPEKYCFVVLHHSYLLLCLCLICRAKQQALGVDFWADPNTAPNNAKALKRNFGQPVRRRKQRTEQIVHVCDVARVSKNCTCLYWSMYVPFTHSMCVPYHSYTACMYLLQFFMHHTRPFTHKCKTTNKKLSSCMAVSCSLKRRQLHLDILII